MDLHSGIVTSLHFALAQARICDAVERETLAFWRELIHEAVEARARCSRFEARVAHDLEELVRALEQEVHRIGVAVAPQLTIRQPQL